MFKAIGAVLVTLVVGGVADVAARSAAESQIEATVAQQTAGATGVSASISSFPFLPRLLLSGRAGNVSVHVDRVAAAEIDLTDIDLAATGVVVDRDRLIPSFQVRVVDVDQVQFSLRLAEADLSEELGLPVDITPSAARVTVQGRKVVAELRVEGETLVVDLDGNSALEVPLPRSPLLPCRGEVRLAQSALELFCSAADVPPALLSLAQR